MKLLVCPAQIVLHFIHVSVGGGGPNTIEIAFGGGKTAHDVGVCLETVCACDRLPPLNEDGQVLSKPAVYFFMDFASLRLWKPLKPGSHPS